MKKKIIMMLGFSVALTMNSCTNLEENLIGDITSDINVEGIPIPGDQGGGGIMGAAYASLRDAGTANHGGYYSIQELTTDEMVIAAKGGDWFDGGILIQLHQHEYDPTHAFINGTWSQNYSAINTVNEVLERTDLDANTISQAKVLRAYYYWRLMDLYGSVKIVTETSDDPPQASRLEVFEFVEKQILDALDIPAVSAGMDLSNSPLGTDNNSYSINQYGALGILAKVYLNAEVYSGTARWAEAAAAADYIINGGVYALCGDGCEVDNLGKRPDVATDPDILSGYAAVFAPNNDGNPEHIFVANFDEVTGPNMNFSQMNLHYSSQFTWNLQSQPWNGYATLEEFYNSYEDGDARKANNFIVGDQLDFGGSAILDYASDDESLVLSYNPSINEIFPNSQREGGARPGKFSFQQLGRDNMNNDYPIVRLGDIHLVRGEAMARDAGNWNMSLNDVNMIRARAGVSALSTIDAEGFLAERGREMFQECSRRTDMIRFDAYNDAWWEKAASDAHYNIFPIPNDQITASGGSLTQNPGY
ncbi:MAG: hypothetical protein ACI86M_000732 [Saprospiraceae bacterium]|jgi:hypothetical protein